GRGRGHRARDQGAGAVNGAAPPAPQGAAPAGRCRGRGGGGALPLLPRHGTHRQAIDAILSRGAAPGRTVVIARIHGTLLVRELDRVEVLTPGGVGYELSIPRTVYERLPPVGREVALRTYQIVREDALLLFGFLEDSERVVFSRLLTATGVGPRLALSLLSALPA